MRKLLCLLGMGLLPACAFAQAAVPSDAERQRAAVMILVLVVAGVLVTFLLLWFLRISGRLPEEKPADPLKDLKDQIARRSDELDRK